MLRAACPCHKSCQESSHYVNKAFGGRQGPWYRVRCGSAKSVGCRIHRVQPRVEDLFANGFDFIFSCRHTIFSSRTSFGLLVGLERKVAFGRRDGQFCCGGMSLLRGVDREHCVTSAFQNTHQHYSRHRSSWRSVGWLGGNSTDTEICPCLPKLLLCDDRGRNIQESSIANVESM